MNIPGIERETVITYNEQEKTAVAYTCNPALKRKLEGFADSRPDECRLLRRYPDGIGMQYEGRNHSTVLNSIRKIEELLKTDQETADSVRDISSNINSRS